MKTRGFVLVLILLLVNVRFSYAKDPIATGSKVTTVKSVVEVPETTSVQNVGHPGLQNNFVQKVDNTLPAPNENFNLSFIQDAQPDTTNFCFIEYYIKNVAPATKKVGFDSKSLEMLEVL